MKKKYNSYFAGLLLMGALSVKAQVSTLYTFSQFQGSYTPVSGGTVFTTPTSDDENILDPAVPGGVAGAANGPGMPIGFNFVFNNYTFNRVAVSNNGYIMFGNSSNGNTAIQFQTSGANEHLRPISFTSTSPPVNQHRVAALGNDLMGQPTSNIRVETMGAWPTRTMVAQWTDYRVFNASNLTGDTINFQIRLYETTNIVDVIYGKVKSVTLDTVAQVGLRGLSNADFNNRSVTGSLTWATSVAGTASNYFARYNSTLFPGSGLTYRWAPAQCSGTLAAATPTGLGLICPGGTSTIGVNNTYTMSGITYTWTSSVFSNMGPFTPITNANDPTYYTPPINQTTWYQVLATCINSGATSTTSAFQVQVAGTSFSTVPYYEGFEGIYFPKQLPNCSWLTTNTTVCETYTTGTLNNRIPKTGSRFAAFKAPTNAAGDYFFSNAIQLNAGVTYSAAVHYITDGAAGWSNFSIQTGTAQNAASMVNIVSDSPATTNIYKLLSSLFTVPVSGTYYIGIKCIGNSTPQYLSWDDLSITVPCSMNAPNLSITASSPTVCTGQSVIISASGADTYTWNTGATGSTISVSPMANNTYTVSGQSSLSGCIKTISQPVTVYNSPALTVSSNTNAICPGGGATLMAVGASSYLWDNGGTNYYNIVHPNNTTVYSVNGSNAKCTVTASYTINVHPAPVIAITSSGATTICKGDQVTLQGNGAVSYLWNSGISGLVQGTSIQAHPSANITYTVTGTDANGCTGTTNYQMTVNECVGMKENNLLSASIYPNPATTEINVVAADAVSYEISDVSGRMISNGKLSGLKSSIAIEGFSPGVYYLKVINTGAFSVAKFIKE